MKKLICLVLSAALLLALCACTQEPGENTSQAQSQEETAVDPYEPVRLDIKDVDGDGIIRVACLGDSITQGNPDSNWPSFLGELLNTLNDGNTYEVNNHGKAGAAVRHYLENYPNLDTDGDGMAYFYYDDPKYTSSLEYTPDVVIVQFGSNDGLGGNAEQIEDYFKSDYYNYLIKPYKDKGSLVVLATPPYATNGWVDEPVNGRISEMVREMAAEYGLSYVDINKATQYRRESFPDGIHGNKSGYWLISQTYFNKIFGGKVWSVTFKTAPGAAIYLDDYMCTADENGEVTISVRDYGASRNFDVKITCKDYKNFTDSVILNASATLTFDLKPGQFDVTGSATATASSVCQTCKDNGEFNEAQKAVDGDLSTRWESRHADNEWLLIDLGTVKNINGTQIFWEGAYSSRYSIEVSTDGENFTQAADVTLDHEGEDITVFDAVDARYVRINCIKRAIAWGNSIREIKILSDVR